METKGSKHVTGYVETEADAMTSQVETECYVQKPVHVETSSSEETSTHPSSTLPTETNGTSTEHSTSETPTNHDTSNTGEIGAEKEAADSTMDIEKDTSMQNLESPKTPVAYLDDESKTDAYNDNEIIPDTVNVTQIPVINAKATDTGNDTVETSTNLMLSPEKTETIVEPTSKKVVLKLQPLNDIEIDIWRNKVGCYYQFIADPTPSNEKSASVLQTSEENDDRPISLRGQKGVDYTSMLTSDLDSEVEMDRKTPK